MNRYLDAVERVPPRQKMWRVVPERSIFAEFGFGVIVGVVANIVVRKVYES